MKIAINKLLILFSALALISLSSCKEKGCTDPSAINYNSIATEDDGSCITCTQHVDTLGTISDDLFDYNSNGPHYSDLVATFYVTQVKNKYTYSECGGNDCYLYVICQSYVPEKMIFNWSVQGSGNVSFNRSNVSTVPGFQSVVVDSIPSVNISNPCGFINSTSLFVSTFGNIQYVL